MKKLYALLLLGSLLLLGTNSAWATYYFRGDGNSWGVTEMQLVSGSNQIYYYTIPSANVNYGSGEAGHNYFKITNSSSGDDWTSVVTLSNTNNSLSDDDGDFWSNGDGAIGFYISSSTSITVYYNKSTETVFVRKTPNKLVTINVTGAVNPYLYAWNSEDETIHYNGNWPDKNPGGTQNGVDQGSDTYKFTLSVPSDVKLKVVFNDGTNQTCDIFVGYISSDVTYSYTITDDYKISAFVGDFNDWYFDDPLEPVMVKTLSVGNYQFKIVDQNVWYGWGTGDNYKTFEGNDYKDLYADNHNLILNATTAGDYVFGWAPEVDPKILFVTFPGSYSRYMTVAHPWATICLPYAVTAEQRAAANATFYSINYTANSKLYLTEETGALVAGRPYIFHFNGESDATLTISCGTTASAASSNNGLIGTYKKVRVATNNYIIVDDKVCRVNAEAQAFCDATKAYIDLTGVPTEPQTSAPGQRVIEMTLVGNNATDINAIEASEEAVKFFQNGKLFIQKNGVVYDMMGTIVK